MATATATTKAHTGRKLSPQAREAKAEARAAELATMKENLDAKVLELCNSEQWMGMLKAMSSLHNYSWNNLMLIWLQNNEATRCAGYQTWKKLGYQVRKGEKGLRIFGTGTGKRYDDNGQVILDDDGKPLTYRYYFPVTVFDVSQVDATEDAHPFIDDLVQDIEGEDEAGVFETLKSVWAARGWKVVGHEETNTRVKAVKGFTRSSEKLIMVRSDMSPAAQVKTLIHESAHALLHDGITDYHTEARSVYETEAESVAYVVANALGIDTGSYSVGYVANWSDGNAEMMRSTAENVLKTSREILGWLTEEPAEETK